MSAHTGSCRCGLIATEAGAEPFLRSYCHCRDCRKQTGAPVMAFVGFREKDLTWHGEAKTWRAGGVVRSFCGHCGSQIGYRDDKLPGEVYLALGFMDEPERYPPTVHAFSRRRLPFVHMADDLPHFDGFSVDR
ncbi:GFA family protein [Aquamicrobium sp. LC103]|uniref:GFA family protein n=1 Tax=Aquamicrobium sp. LC103 TaxID=1120658 RepID=UPI00063EB271|nr:GFA family protein [Aquamicrobium sp. LC103]TKT82754.1 GFA family protein [Aquamicrobium sp. LC103]